MGRATRASSCSGVTTSKRLSTIQEGGCIRLAQNTFLSYAIAMRLALPPSRPLALSLALCAALASTAAAQAKDSTKKEKYTSSKFWESTAPFELTLATNLKQINSDNGDPGP